MMFEDRLKLFIFIIILSLLFVPLAFAETREWGTFIIL